MIPNGRVGESTVRYINMTRGSNSKHRKRVIIDALILRDNGSYCRYCRKMLRRGEHTIDHVNPLGNGGADRLCNMVLACRCCNQLKADLYWILPPPKPRHRNVQRINAATPPD